MMFRQRFVQPSTFSSPLRVLACALGLTVMGSSLSGCVTVLMGGAMLGGSMVALDRRTSGAQLEDKTIQLKTANRLAEALGDRAHVNVNSYNRQVLLTGEALSEADRAQAEQVASRVENVRHVVNEIGVMGVSSLTSRSNDLLLEGKVKATFIDAKDLQANAFKIVVERGTVFLMGRVTEREAVRAAELTSGIAGVNRVVKVFELISEAELAELVPPSNSPAGNGQAVR